MAGEIKKRLDELVKDLSDTKLTQVSYEYFKRETPIKSGFARTHTLLNKNTIEANYPYAQRLDNGYSKQAPDGMTKPTLNFILKYIKRQEK